MVVIYAEKADMGKKIAAALDAIHLDNGTTVSFEQLTAKADKVAEQGRKDGFFKIDFKGEEAYVTWGRGHLCTLKQAKDYDPSYSNWKNLPVPFIPAKFELKQIDAGDAAKWYAKQMSTIKKLFDKADYIISSTDADREGEVIFAYVYEFLKCSKPYKRALFSEQSKEGICDAFDKLVDSSEVKNIEYAGRARNIADAIVGWNLTAQTTLHNHSKEILSVGRVQTATLNILVQRELAIKKFVPVDYYTLEGIFTTNKGETYKGLHRQKRFDKKEDADNAFSQVNGKTGTITYLDKKTEQVPVPELLNQDVLQMECNEKFGLKMKDTLNIAQFLYDNGYTTYPRTSSRYLTEDMKGKVDFVLDQLSTMKEYAPLIKGKARSFYTKRFFDNSKVKSHFAIIPTGVIPTGLNPTQQRVYDLICRSVIRMLYPSAKVENTKVITTVNGNDFLSSGKTIVDEGWLQVSGVPKTTIIPPLSMGEKVEGEYKTESKKTQPPQRYTDKTLTKAMISAGKDISDKELRELLSDPQDGGIGTTATRADIVETLISRHYAERKGKQFFVTDKGMELIQKLPVEDIKSAEITAKWEKRLNEIADGKDTLSSFVKDISDTVAKWCKEINTSSIMKPTYGTSSTKPLNCPVCGKPLNKFKWGWGCSGYKEGCKFSIGTICGKMLSDTQVDTLLSKKKTPLISGFKSKKGKPFKAHLILKPSGEVAFEFDLAKKS